VALARACFIWGDIRARSDGEKLEAYDRGRQVAQRAVEVSPKSAAAHFWYATNTARWGQTKGILRSLVLLPTVQEEIRLITIGQGFVRAGDLVEPTLVPPSAGVSDAANQRLGDAQAKR